LFAVALPVAEMGQLLLGARGTEITGLTFVYGVGGVIRIERNRVRHTTCLGEGARFTTQFGRDNAGADQGVGINVTIRGKEKSFGFAAMIVHFGLLTNLHG
jgi:hypothetical protein